MTSTITIISPSINRDKAFRERLTGNLTSDKELLAVIREAFNGEKNDMFSREGGVISVDESRYDGNNGGCVGGGKSKREELEIRAKLFLQDFDSDSATDAIEAVLKHIGEWLKFVHVQSRSTRATTVLDNNCLVLGQQL